MTRPQRQFANRTLGVALLAALVAVPLVPAHCTACQRIEGRDCCSRPAADVPDGGCCQRTTVAERHFFCGCAGCHADSHCSSCPGWEAAEHAAILSTSLTASLSRKTLTEPTFGSAACLPLFAPVFDGLDAGASQAAVPSLATQAPLVPHRILHCSWLI